MSTLKTNNVQVGQSVTATNNFTIYQPSTPDGTVRIGVGNSGATTADVLTANSSGNVGIGTSSPSSYTSGDQLVIASASGNGQMTLAGADNGNPTLNFRRVSSPSTTRGYIQYDNTAEWMRFATNGSERARIDSSGNLLVGATSQPIGGVTTRLSVSYATSDYSFGVRSTAGTPYGIIVNYSTTPNNTGSEVIYFSDSTTGRFVVRSNGGIANYSGNDANLSDRREKTNFAPAGEYLSKICAIPVQTFNYIDQNLEEDSGLTLGVVAQDVQAVAPELVSESNWGTQEEPKVRLSIYQTDMQYALMKCIQEQQAMIEELKAKVAALEGAKG